MTSFTKFFQLSACDHGKAALVYLSSLNGDCNFKAQLCPQCSNPEMGNGFNEVGKPGRCTVGAGSKDQPFLLENDVLDDQSVIFLVHQSICVPGSVLESSSQSVVPCPAD